jgi:2-iminobutanoate/2-iminopropanoate deaminase
MRIISTGKAPKAIGPYSQAIAAGNFIFTSGQIPLNANNELVKGGIQAQAEQVFKNIEAIIAKAGLKLSDVIKVNVFLSDLNDFDEMNKVYEKYFRHRPARSTVEVRRLPKDVRMEVDAIAIKET